MSKQKAYRMSETKTGASYGSIGVLPDGQLLWIAFHKDNYTVHLFHHSIISSVDIGFNMHNARLLRDSLSLILKDFDNREVVSSSTKDKGDN